MILIPQEFHEHSQASHSDQGSVAPLILGLFAILMSAVYIVSDISAVYIDRRDLISETEAALYQASEELDEVTYYSSGPRSSVPLDCGAAEGRFRKDLPTNIDIRDFLCDGRELIAQVDREIELPFQVRAISITRFTNRIRAGVRTDYLR